ncbi:MAG: hypothetical protein R2882_13985 [Gemmatimonadales bacterium]
MVGFAALVALVTGLGASLWPIARNSAGSRRLTCSGLPASMGRQGGAVPRVGDC